jgi:hypothetical protein
LDEGRRVADSPQASVSAQLVPLWGKILLGIFLAAVGGLLVYVLFALWPAVHAATAEQNATAAPSEPETISLFGVSYTPEPDVTLLLLVAVLSALGSYIHAAQSFVDFAGNRRLVISWVWWYPFRILIGVALAEIFYFAIRAGFLGTDTPTSSINPYGIAAISGLVGLFSKQATDKLREVFETLFRTESGGDETRKDSLTNPVPVLAAVEPPELDVATQQLEITLRGKGFVRESIVRVSAPSPGGDVAVPRRTTYVSSSELTVTLEESDVANAGSLSLSVFNPGPGGGSSDSVPVSVS